MLFVFVMNVRGKIFSEVEKSTADVWESFYFHKQNLMLEDAVVLPNIDLSYPEVCIPLPRIFWFHLDPLFPTRNLPAAEISS